MVTYMNQHNEEEAILSLLELLPSYFQYFNNFTELKESGAAGRQKINQINRYLGIIIAFIEGFAMSFALVKDATAIDYFKRTGNESGCAISQTSTDFP